MKVKKVLFVLLSVFYCSGLFAQTGGTLQVTTTTESTGGKYAPRNVVAIWVEDGNGHFVKTLAAYAAIRKTYLNNWEKSTTDAGSAFNTVDATTGATRSSHGTLTCTWNGTDYQGNQVVDGSYNVRFELTDKDATGNSAQVSFTKGNESLQLRPADVPSFKTTSVVWNPATIAGANTITRSDDVKLFYDRASGQLSVMGADVKNVEIYNCVGERVLKGASSVLYLTNVPDGIYFVAIKTGSTTVSKKMIKH